MNRPLFYLLSLCLIASLNAQASSMKQAKKEAQKIAKEEIAHLKKEFSNNKLSFSEQDLLPKEDQGKRFDAKTADNQFKYAPKHVEASEMGLFLKTTKKPDSLDRNEDFLVDGHRIIQDPHSSLNLKAINTPSIPAKEILETCQEAGTYQIHFNQNLIIQVAPEEKQSIKHCKGHQRSKSYSTKGKAKQHVSSKKEKFKQDVTLQSFEVHRDQSQVVWSWTHQDNVASCDHFTLEEKVLKETAEEEYWETDSAESLHSVESNPSCKLLYTKILHGPETRLIDGKPVHRDTWARQLFFSCESDSDSKCAKLREQGAVLIRKKCLEPNVFGECDRWEKIYDVGKRATLQQTKAPFQNKVLWGLQNEFETSYEKNTDWGQTLATLSAFAELEHTLEEQGSDFHDKVQIFKGENLKCQKSFLKGNIFDCCKKMEGIAVSIKLANCKTEEKCLAKYRHEGKCHFVGSQHVNLGTVTEHVYCCFPSKLSRIIHEQGRQQLGIKWGKAGKPQCRGLSLEELQRIDFSKIDLTEVIEDIKLDQQALTMRLQHSVEPLQAKVQSQVGQKKKERRVDQTPTISEGWLSKGDHDE